MFSFGRREEVSTHPVVKLALSPKQHSASPQNLKKNHPFPGNANGGNATPSKRRFGRPSHFRNKKEIEQMNVQDTTDGVEVCLENNQSKGGGPASPHDTRDPPQRPIRAEPVISWEAQWKQMKKVYKSQYATRAFSVLSNTTSQTGTLTSSSTPSNIWRPKGHRIPLSGMENSRVVLNYDESLNLLTHTLVLDETTAVQQEYKLLEQELENLENDRNHLRETVYELPIPSVKDKPSATVHSATAAPSHQIHSMDWDVQSLLDSTSTTTLQRTQLLKKRGNCVTICIGSARSRETFLSKCGAKLPELLKAATATRGGTLLPPPQDCLTLGPHNCRPGGAATGLRQVVLLPGEDERPTLRQPSSPMSMGPLSPTSAVAAAASLSGFFLARDTGKSQLCGRLPPRLFRRIQTDKQYEVGQISKLSTGPMGSYFCQFQSGEQWWGSASTERDDDDLFRVLETWDVYKVVFGPVSTLTGPQIKKEDGSLSPTQRLAFSWIVLSNDGKVAYKNIPRRLQDALEQRSTSWAAIADVSLGVGGSYFCRFLDGTCDYCLPAHIAHACDYIQQNGGNLTEVILHPEISGDFLIRHSELS